MDKWFLALNETTYTYADLVSDLNKMDSYNSYIYDKNGNVYTILVRILHAMIYDYPVVLVDSGLSEHELQEIGIDPRLMAESRPTPGFRPLSEFKEAIDAIRRSHRCSITLFTSGTTGKPKKVCHSIRNLLRGVVVSERHANDVWALAYNPTHIAGVLVFLQAVMNQNPLVYAFGDLQTRLGRLLAQYEITHISATPTYYRSILPTLRDLYPYVRQITFGGEKFDEKLKERLRPYFPNARFLNIYALTEAGSVLTGDGEWFEIDEKNERFVKIGQDGEIYVHHSLLGDWDHGPKQEWYATGDIVEKGRDGKFRFISRKSEFINVGGYKVNPNEIEKVLLEVRGVVDVSVKGVLNSVTGNILVADVVKDGRCDPVSLKKAIKAHAASKLQPWKVPRIIHFVDRILTSHTGKKLRSP